MLFVARATARFFAKVRAATATTSKIWCAVLLAGSCSWQVAVKPEDKGVARWEVPV